MLLLIYRIKQKRNSEGFVQFDSLLTEETDSNFKFLRVIWTRINESNLDQSWSARIIQIFQKQPDERWLSDSETDSLEIIYE